MRAGHQAAPPLPEEPACAVDGFEVVLGGDDGMVAAVGVDLVLEELGVGGDLGGDLVGIDKEDPLDAVLGGGPWRCGRLALG
jgi:hypothetical protein